MGKSGMTGGEVASGGDNGAHQHELDALKEELRALKNTIVDGLIIIDENKKILSFNPGAEKIFGYTAAEVTGQNVNMLMPEPYRAEHDVYVDNYRRSGDAKIIGIGREVKGRRQDGTTFPMYLSVGEMRSGAGRQFVGIVRDLSDLKENQGLIQGIASNLPGPVFRRVRCADGTLSFTYVSEGLRRVFDLDPARVMSDPDYLINAIHPDDREGWRAALKTSADTMAPYDYSMRITGANGGTKWMHAIAHPYHSGNGDVVWDGLALDITAQKRAETEREESHKQYRDLLEAAPDAIWISDGHSIIYANSEAARLFGAKDASELIGRDNLDLVFADDRDEVTRRRVDLRQGERLPAAEIRRQRLDGKIIDTETSAIGVSWDGGSANLIIARDITARKLVESRSRRSEKMEAIGQLTGGVAHDFNNLLAVLMMDLEELSDKLEGDEEAEGVLAEALDVAQSAAELTARLLAFSRQQDLEPQRVAAQDVISESMALLRRTIGEHIEFDLVTSRDAWPVVVDPRQFENALLNLAINARDAMPSGGRITIETSNVFLDDDYADGIDGLEAGEYVQVSVTDTGNGIPMDIQNQVFDPFFTTKDAGSGTGLGLSMVYGFAKQSGGHASIYSEEGHGTTVSLYLPRVQAESPPERKTDRASHIQTTGSETILLVEDFPQLRKRGTQMLTDLGYTVIEAENANEALAELEAADNVDLLFTDIVMPGGMNGFELAEMARRYRPGLKVLFTSGYAEGAEIELTATDTGDLRLHKPYSRQDLARTVRRALDTT